MAMACFFVFLFSFLPFYIQTKKEEHFKRLKKVMNQLCLNALSHHKAKTPKKLRLIITLYYFVQITISMLLMLIWMTYNWWIILSSCLGAMIGYFIYESKWDVNPETSQFLC
jgi:hypothetical protein